MSELIPLKGNRLDVQKKGETPFKRAEPPWKALFSLNVAFAIVSALFMYDGEFHLANSPRIIRESLEAFSRILADIAPLSSHGRTKLELWRSAVIREVVFVSLTFVIALSLYSLSKLVIRMHPGRRILVFFSGAAAFIAVPVCWLYIVRATRSIYELTSFSIAYGYALLLEVVIVAGLLYILRKQAIWPSATVCILHYLFWMLLMLPHLFNCFVGLPLSLLFPWSEIVWLRLVRMPSQKTSPPTA